MLFYVSSPYSVSYATRPHREQHRAYWYATAIFVNSHKVHCNSILQSVNTFSYLVSRFSITLTITSKPSLSSLVNRSVIGASISRTPIISSLTWIGITISDLLFASQAMWPGNACTSLTNWVLSSATAVPQTPLPIAIWTQPDDLGRVQEWVLHFQLDKTNPINLI